MPECIQTRVSSYTDVGVFSNCDSVRLAIYDSTKSSILPLVHTKGDMASHRSTKLHLSVDRLGKELVAERSDLIVVVVEVTDDNGNVR